MKSPPLVSIVMALYNAEDYLDECIQSILDQTLKNWELILINDGSTDNSINIAKKYQIKDSRIVLFDLEINHKLVFCLNLGIKNAQGEFIARMDADDIMLPNRLEEQVSHLNNNLEVGIIGSDLEIIDSNGQSITVWKYPNENSQLKKLLIKKCPFAHPAVMFRKTLVENMVDVYDRKYSSSEDYDLWIRLHKQTSFYSINHPLIKYRVHDKQITQSKIKMVSFDTLRLIINSVSSGKLSFKALFYLWKPVFYILSPKYLIDFVIRRRDNTFN